MESTLASDNREQFDQAANALMTSLRKSRDLNIEIRQALLLREQVDSSTNAEASGESHHGASHSGESESGETQSGKSYTTVFRMLSDIVDRVCRLLGAVANSLARPPDGRGSFVETPSGSKS